MGPPVKFSWSSQGRYHLQASISKNFLRPKGAGTDNGNSLLYVGYCLCSIYHLILIHVTSVYPCRSKPMASSAFPRPVPSILLGWIEGGFTGPPRPLYKPRFNPPAQSQATPRAPTSHRGWCRVDRRSFNVTNYTNSSKAIHAIAPLLSNATAFEYTVTSTTPNASSAPFERM